MPYSGWSNGFIDYNNDGWKDIYSSNGDVDMVNAKSPQHDTMFENVDGKSFVDVSEEMGKDFLRKGYQRGSAFGDLNNDGALDIVVTSLNEAAAHPDEHRRHRQSLAGAEPGRAQERARRDRRQGQTHHWHPAGCCTTTWPSASGSCPPATSACISGWARKPKINSVEIRWPSGIQQTLKGPAADQFLTVDEPQK